MVCAAGAVSKERFSKKGLWVRQVSLKCQVGGIIKQTETNYTNIHYENAKCVAREKVKT